MQLRNETSLAMTRGRSVSKTLKCVQCRP